jgi:hypothetical protein
MARNRGIFQGLKSSSEMVDTKFVGLFLECFNSRGLRTIQPDALDLWEIKWMESVGGVLHDPRGKIKTTYSWNIGVASNNQAESYALLQGLLIAKSKNIGIYL